MPTYPCGGIVFSFYIIVDIDDIGGCLDRESSDANND